MAGDDLDSDGVTYLEWLDPERLLVSYRRSGSLVVRCARTDPAPSVLDQVKAAFHEAKENPTLLPPGLCAAIRMRSGYWILVGENGAVWRASEDHQRIETEPRFWPKGEVPGFVSDFAYIKESIQLLAARELGILDKSEKDTLEEALDLRNRCGHPSKYRPGVKKVSAFMEDMVSIVFA